MTKEQLAAISDMQLSRDNLMQISQELGLSIGGRGMGAMSEEQKATAEAHKPVGGGAPMGGAMMGGGGPGGGMPGGGMMGGAPGQNSTGDSEETSSRVSQPSELNSTMLEAIIKYLQSRTQ
jgi:hypothetical protein